MELFRLLGTIAIQNESAIAEIKETTKEAERAENRISKSFKTIGQKSVDLGKKMAVASAAAGGALVGIVKSSANVAAEVSAYEQIMGSYADTASKKLAGVADAVGMADTRLTPYMTSMTAKFQGLGLDIEQSTDLASSGLTIAADAAAFWDKSLEDSMSALNSFVNGNYEGGESIGLFANETTLAKYAAEELGLEWQNMTEAEKQITRLNFAEEMQRTSQVTGQAAKESGQYANVMAELKESIRQMAASLGEVVLPVVTKITEGITSFIQKLDGMGTGVKVVIVALIALVAAASPLLIVFGMVATGIGSIISLFGTLKTLLPVVTSAFSKLGAVLLANPIGLVIAAVAALVAAFVYLWKNCEGFREFWINLWENIKEKAVDAKEKVVKIFNTVIDFFKNNWKQLLLFIVNPFAGAFALLYKNVDAFRNKIKAVIDKIKSFFNVTLKFKGIKLPKIDVKWDASGLKGKAAKLLGLDGFPSLSVKWNALGAVFKKPTIFNTPYGLQGVGEAGSEAIAPIDTLQQYVAGAVASQNMELVSILQGILSAIKQMDAGMYQNIEKALDNRKIQWNDRELGRLVNKYA